MKICSVIGARPQFIKSAPLSKKLADRNIDEIIIHTGQHYDKNMSDIFFEQLNIPKEKYNLNINQLSHGAMTGRMIESIENILLLEKPDYVLVYGDTNSTLAAAIAASKLHIKIIHVEAGLRSFNRLMPEEINRLLTDHLSEILFCASDISIKNLKNEGVHKNAIYVGDIMKDSMLFFSKENEPTSKDFSDILVTIHREESVKNKRKLTNIINSLNQLSKEFKICFPIHPSTRKKLEEFNLSLEFETQNPVGFLEMIRKIKGTKVALSDSGGLQKETYYLEKPCVVLREETEWIELLTEGVNSLCSAKEDMIINLVTNKINAKFNYNQDMYGSGDTADKIVNFIEEHFSNGG